MQNNESYTSSPDTATQSIKKLPSDFHERLFECEMEMEKEDVDMEVVNDLLNLYAVIHIFHFYFIYSFIIIIKRIIKINHIIQKYIIQRAIEYYESQ